MQRCECGCVRRGRARGRAGARARVCFGACLTPAALSTSQVMAQQIPQCRRPRCTGVIKPNITFFGEKLKPKVGRCLEADHDKVDLLIVMGTSLQAHPAPHTGSTAVNPAGLGFACIAMIARPSQSPACALPPCCWSRAPGLAHSSVPARCHMQFSAFPATSDVSVPRWRPCPACSATCRAGCRRS